MTDSSMSYEPEEDEEEFDQEVSDDDSCRHIDFTEAFEPSSPPLQKSRLNSNCINGSIASQTAPVCRKRRRPKSRSQALRAAATLPINTYSQIYHEALNDILRGPDSGVTSYFHHTQYGVVSWTAMEKNILFSALARKGKDAVPEISALVGTKSQMEVRHYLDLLQRSFTLYHATGPELRTIAMSNIPAAYEVSNECCLALERVADALSLRDEQTQIVAGRRKHGDLWLVDRAVAAYVDYELGPGPEPDPASDLAAEVISEPDQKANLQPESGSQPKKDTSTGDKTVRPHSLFATAKLLKLSNWIRLSERLFMNSGSQNIENNWHSLCLENETPALTCDALSDFYALTVSITRRVIQSSIFFALSRMRAVERSGVVPEKLVKKDDIYAALDVLKMKRDAKDFWVGAARRCLLDVRHETGEWAKTALITYDEVEYLLDTPSNVDAPIQRKESQPETPIIEISSDSDDDFSNSSDISMSTAADDATEHDDHLSDPEEITADAVDQQASRDEETRLWLHITKPTPQLSSAELKPKPEIRDKNASRKLRGKRKWPHESADWRDTVLYQAEWETLGPDTLEIDEEMTSGSKKRPRLDWDD